MGRAATKTIANFFNIFLPGSPLLKAERKRYVPIPPKFKPGDSSRDSSLKLSGT